MDINELLEEYKRKPLYPRFLRISQRSLTIDWLEGILKQFPSGLAASGDYEKGVEDLLQEGATRARMIGLIENSLNHRSLLTYQESISLESDINDLANDLNLLCDAAPTLRANPEECPLREAKVSLNSELRKT